MTVLPRPHNCLPGYKLGPAPEVLRGTSARGELSDQVAARAVVVGFPAFGRWRGGRCSAATPRIPSPWSDRVERWHEPREAVLGRWALSPDATSQGRVFLAI